MNLTLILTRDCNLRCSYCFETHGCEKMTEAVINAAADLAVSDARKRCGFSLFGGEPLLERDAVCHAVETLETRCRPLGITPDFTMTTNGMLLDEAFLCYADRHRIRLALSWDGLAQDDCRRTAGGRPTADAVEGAWTLLSRHQPNAVVMYTVAVSAVGKLADSVDFLFDRGVRRLSVTIDERPDAGWNDDALRLLGEQYEKMALRYADRLLAGEDLVILSVNEKWRSHLLGEDYCAHDCRLGKRQPLVWPDGGLYPCIQFGGVEEYRYGTVFTGIDAERQRAIYELSRRSDPDCADCPLQRRCKHTCACLNFQHTGDPLRVSDLQCRHEQLLITAADRAGERLFPNASDTLVTKICRKTST